MSDDFILSVRNLPRGGGPRTTVIEERRPHPGMVLLVYVHGFNVNRARALEQWGHLRGLITMTTQVQCGLFLWPSDRFASRFVSRMYFPPMVSLAQACGRRLGAYLQDRKLRAILVGHSLGARVILEAADRFRAGSLIDGIGLLGAAVPVNEMEDGGSFDISLAQREAVAYSARDPVLGRPFRFGAFLATPFASHAEAVGLNGEPAARKWFRMDFEINHHEHWKVPAARQFITSLTGPYSVRMAKESLMPPERRPLQRPMP